MAPRRWIYRKLIEKGGLLETRGLFETGVGLNRGFTVASHAVVFRGLVLLGGSNTSPLKNDCVVTILSRVSHVTHQVWTCAVC